MGFFRRFPVPFIHDQRNYWLNEPQRERASRLSGVKMVAVQIKMPAND
jgi:hypothetical protein